jgi:hypothetical protein
VALVRRDRELARRESGKLYEKLIKSFSECYKAFVDQAQRCDDIRDYWDAYNCKLNSNQKYDGNACLYVPIIYNAVEARKTRFLNQMFPASRRYIDATSTDAGVPHGIVALLEHYIEKTHMRTQVVAPLLLNGDIEGQYNLYVDWNRIERHIVSRETRPVSVPVRGVGPVAAEDEEVEDISEETIVDASPCFEVLHDEDVLVLPKTSNSIDHALAQGGKVAIIRRWTKATIEEMLDRGELVKGPTESLLEMSTNDSFLREAARAHPDAAGFKAAGNYFQIYELWECLELPGEGRRLCKSIYGGHELILSARRNPNWNDKCPLISAPVRKIAGSFKGESPISKGVDTLQYQANDIANQGADSATYSMLPIIIADPAKNPRTSTMVLNLAAIWEADPNSIRFAEFPKLWQDAIPQIQSYTALIFQTMGVNPAMLPQQTGRPGAKRNQAEVALEQTVDVLTTAEQCSIVEEGVLTPVAHMMVDLDHQYRDEELSVRLYGELGVVANMEKVPPLQSIGRFNFTWFGVEQARSIANQQQEIAFLNVAVSPAMAGALQKSGYEVNPAPALESAAGHIFGWRKGRQIIVDARSRLSRPAELENTMLSEGFAVPVSPTDDDVAHLKVHMMGLQAGDETGAIRLHIEKHMAQMQIKSQGALRGSMAQPGQPGQPGQGGGPQPGAQPQNVRPLRGPPGMIHKDQMPAAGAAIMPRKF